MVKYKFTQNPKFLVTKILLQQILVRPKTILANPKFENLVKSQCIHYGKITYRFVNYVSYYFAIKECFFFGMITIMKIFCKRALQGFNFIRFPHFGLCRDYVVIPRIFTLPFYFISTLSRYFYDAKIPFFGIQSSPTFNRYYLVPYSFLVIFENVAIFIVL